VGSFGHRSCHEQIQAEASARSAIDRTCQRWIAGSWYASNTAGASSPCHGLITNPSSWSVGWAIARMHPAATRGFVRLGMAPIISHAIVF
jgi:hypothetical protein